MSNMLNETKDGKMEIAKASTLKCFQKSKNFMIKSENT